MMLVLTCLIQFSLVQGRIDMSWYKDIPVAYEESPCFQKSTDLTPKHKCNEYEKCVPEGQHLYNCCRYNTGTFQCRPGNPHPCLGKNPCSKDEFCHRIVKANEESNDFECIKKDEDCIGMTMCTEHYFGSCSANNENPPERIIVQSVDDCYNECKSDEKCKGFDLDSKGGCLLAYKSCSKNELVEHPIFDDDDSNNYGHFQQMYMKFFMHRQNFENLQFTYYPMDGCKTPERSPECDKTLADKIDEHMALIMQSLHSMMPYFDQLNDQLDENTEDDEQFRSILRDIIVAFGSVGGVLLLAILAVKLNKLCTQKDNAVGNAPMAESQLNTPANNQTTVGGAVINILPRLRDEPSFNDPAPDYETTLSVTPITTIPEEPEKSPEGPKDNNLP
ncbi:Oidioi.mRNA.OKI2018_I69.chr2.g4612.t1.cds [Oikopleura dioica]|uniref:Oidioi.mRNA.OKI2018_I69.chr2.g4612.t1.cds n=1 Tax=Oikopleura dioica TaxID=34765 RepID=A0ABN7SZG9_OIKDI|nr:Oidioi.mRNA.OKI2018_I69.chr2.g4612.t1.cds [Oikopleura dioica]